MKKMLKILGILAVVLMVLAALVKKCKCFSEWEKRVSYKIGKICDALYISATCSKILVSSKIEEKIEDFKIWRNTKKYVC